MYAIGVTKSSLKEQGFLVPEIILYPSDDIYFFENVLSRKDYLSWDYTQESELLNYIKQLDKIRNIVKSFKVNSPHLSNILLERKRRVAELVTLVKNRKFEYDEVDPSTWVDNFISIEWESEKVSFSYETPDGELLWGLYNSLEPLQKEIELEGALCVVYIE